MDNEHTSVELNVPNRCPKCGTKVDQDETLTLERDPLDATKGKAYHPECWMEQNHPGWTSWG